jgi:hypothetical protein
MRASKKTLSQGAFYLVSFIYLQDQSRAFEASQCRYFLYG